MSLKALQDYIYYSKYARYNKEKKRRETWDEAIDRVKNMHLEKYAGLGVDDEINWAFEMSKQKKVLGSQRALQFGGKPIFKNNARIYNCCSSYCDRIRFFQESMYLLLCGCGVGFSVQKHHIAKLPKFSPILKSKGKRNYTIEDSIEGWSNSLGVLLATYFPHPEYVEWEGYEVTFDYTLIRKKGEPINSGGKAPGFEPLKKSLDIIQQLLEDRLLEGYTRLRPIDAYDIVMHASDCVLSGGVRRSASISLFSLDDEEMMKAKTGDWLNENPQRGRSNNSVVLVRDQTSKDDFKKIVESIREFGEPAFYMTENSEATTNPCFHRDTRILTDHGYRRIYDLYKEGLPVKVCVDNRVVKDEYFENKYGISIKQASEVKLTQKDADIYCVTTEHGNTLYVTNTHEFPTLRGKLKLKDMLVGDTVFLQSGDDFGNRISKIVSIEYFGKDDVFCLNEPETNSVIANGIVTGQCVEIGMFPSYENQSGFSFCNLVEINGSKIKTKEDFALACKAATIIGTLQAGYTDFPYLGETTEKIAKREALLGVSITGTMDSPEIIFNPDIQKEMAQLVVKTNEEFAAKLKINPSARSTCIKPAGTTSLVLGTASGIHPHHAKRYFRAVQANQLETIFQHFKGINPFATEKSVWSAPGSNDEVITFCVEVPAGAKVKNDLSAVELLKYVKLTQNNWVNYGKVEERCAAPGLSHNVSNTINVKPEEWNDVIDFIYDNKESFAGVSLLPSSGDLDYPQAPMVNVLTPKEILKEYGDCALLASGLIVDGLHCFKNNLWKACDITLQIHHEELDQAQMDWIRRVKQFADRYLEGDIRKCCYLMKHVNNWKKWLDLNREFKDVDYTALVELVDETKPMETIACSGGKCDLIY